MLQLEYVADHLEKRDCRRLVAALHDPHFDLLNNMDAAGTNLYSKYIFELHVPYENTIGFL
jgi:hypothetical protein